MRPSLAGVGVTSLGLKRHYFIGAWAFLALTNFEFHCLSIIKGCVTATTLNFRMVYKKVLASVLWSNKTETFVCVEPLNCTFTHLVYSIAWVKKYKLPTTNSPFGSRHKDNLM
mgnify:FL=1